MTDYEYTYTGTLRLCPLCTAPLVASQGAVVGRVVVSRNPRVLTVVFLTPHTDECTAKTEDHPLPTIGWGWGSGSYEKETEI